LNIVVLAKSAVDEAEVRADEAGNAIAKGGARKVSNFDRVGVEEAVRQKERHGGTVTVVSLGTGDAKKQIKEAMAMGADKALLVLAEPVPDALGTAYLISKAVQRLGTFDLLICSEGSSDTYQGEVGAMIAEFLTVPFLADAKKVETDGAKVRCELRADGGVRLVEAELPAVVSVVSEANDPRYPTLLQVMAASKKPIEELPLSSLRDAGYPDTGFQVMEVKLQSADRKRIIIEGSPEEASRKLVEALKKEGVL